jgi:hypothetical protein
MVMVAPVQRQAGAPRASSPPRQKFKAKEDFTETETQ